MSALSPEVVAAVENAASMRLFGLLLERPRPGWRDDVARVAGEVHDATVRALASLADEADEGVYVGLLGPGGPVSPREVAWRGREDPAAVMSDVAAFYEAFAYRPRTEDPVDHVCVEAGFVGYLWLKEAFARAEAATEAAATIAAAREKFVREHFSVLVAGMAARLAVDAPPYVATVVLALGSRLGDPSVPPSADDGEDEPEPACG